jgi:hypothetical protein
MSRLARLVRPAGSVRGGYTRGASNGHRGGHCVHDRAVAPTRSPVPPTSLSRTIGRCALRWNGTGQWRTFEREATHHHDFASLRPQSLVIHEVAHFFTPHVMHDQPWREALIQMLAGEFDVPMGFARELMREAGL